jgi:hypothetical protein
MRTLGDKNSVRGAIEAYQEMLNSENFGHGMKATL